MVIMGSSQTGFDSARAWPAVHPCVTYMRISNPEISFFSHQTRIEAAFVAAGPTEAITQTAAEISAANAAVILFEEMENMVGDP
ncbi:hypothetical protein [Parasphingorhabdus sp.]|uniref:hypothetical protein n=1 Tax=Parasphingorhabdus sp. TaxID=2709688 RepID=UPI003D2C7A9B